MKYIVNQTTTFYGTLALSTYVFFVCLFFSIFNHGHRQLLKTELNSWKFQGNVFEGTSSNLNLSVRFSAGLLISLLITWKPL